MNRFAWITEASIGCPRPMHDQPVMETTKYVVLPTLGSLVPGWLLVVPRRRMANLSMLTAAETSELESVIATLLPAQQVWQATVFSFEHGGAPGSPLSCGVDQAHLHLVPLSFDLFSSAVQCQDINWTPLPLGTPPWGHALAEEYLAIASSDGRAAIGYPRMPTSQWFRRLIANRLGRPNEWDYRAHPGIPYIEQTLTYFGGGIHAK